MSSTVTTFLQKSHMHDFSTVRTRAPRPSAAVFALTATMAGFSARKPAKSVSTSYTLRGGALISASNEAV